MENGMYSRKDLMAVFFAGTAIVMGVIGIVHTRDIEEIFDVIRKHLAVLSSILLFFSGFIYLLYLKMVRAHPALKKQFRVVSITTLLMIAVSYYILNDSESTIITLTVLVSSYVLICGWWVQGVMSKLATKRQHTVNTLLQSRLSATYQSHLSECQSILPSNEYFLSRKVIEVFCERENQSHASTLRLTDEFKKKIRSVCYILNYFEFLAQGIKKEDFDEDLLKLCLAGHVRNLERKFYHLITVENEKDREVFEGFIWLANRWLQDDSLLYQNSSRFNLIQETTLGKQYPNDSSNDETHGGIWATEKS